MTTTTTNRTAIVEQLLGRTLSNVTVGDKWITCEQFASRGLMLQYVDRLKAAGIPAFFRDRTFGFLAD